MSNLIEEFQPRVATGMQAQDAVVDVLRQQFGKQLTDVSVAVVGNKLTDIDVKIKGQPVKFEVKSIRGRPRTSIYSTTVWLEEPKSITGAGQTNKIIDGFVQQLTGKYNTFNQWIAAERKKDKSIGYFGQEGVVNKAGKIPNPKTISDGTIVTAIRKNFVERLRKQEVTYFVIFYEPSHTPFFYYTGYGPNILNVKRAPAIKSVMIDTYGDPASADKDPDDPTYVSLPGKNRMRVALKATFSL